MADGGRQRALEDIWGEGEDDLRQTFWTAVERLGSFYMGNKKEAYDAELFAIEGNSFPREGLRHPHRLAGGYDKNLVGCPPDRDKTWPLRPPNRPLNSTNKESPRW